MAGGANLRKGKQQQKQKPQKSLSSLRRNQSSAEKDSQKSKSNSSFVSKMIAPIGALAVVLSVVAAWGVASRSDAALQQENERVKTKLVSSFRVLETVSHDSESFTQGLEYDAARGHMIEGTGLYGESVLRHLEPRSGRILRESAMPGGEKYFGEGISLYHSEEKNSKDPPDRILQLTWREKTAFVYDAETLDLLSNFTYATVTGEGWGAAYDARKRELYVSDGSDTILVWSVVEGFREVRRFNVASSTGSSIKHLNELEWDASTGTLLANVWYQDVLVRIQPSTGSVTHIYDLRKLYPKDQRPSSADCLNGIAKVGREGDQTYWLTGKLWPSMFLVSLGEE